MKIQIVVLFAIMFIGCNPRESKLAEMPNRKLRFNELPSKIQKNLSNRPKCDDSDMLLLIDSNDSCNYSLESVRTFIGPWIDYERLVDKRRGFSYQINQGTPSPYIIFKNKLYIPDRFNILCGENVFDAVYKEYQLK